MCALVTIISVHYNVIRSSEMIVNHLAPHLTIIGNSTLIPLKTHLQQESFY